MWSKFKQDITLSLKKIAALPARAFIVPLKIRVYLHSILYYELRN